MTPLDIKNYIKGLCNKTLHRHHHDLFHYVQHLGTSDGDSYKMIDMNILQSLQEKKEKNIIAVK